MKTMDTPLRITVCAPLTSSDLSGAFIPESGSRQDRYPSPKVCPVPVGEGYGVGPDELQKLLDPRRVAGCSSRQVE